MTFSWDDAKAAENLKKHGVDSREAATVLDDQLSYTFPDIEHSTDESRFITMGLSARGRPAAGEPRSKEDHVEVAFPRGSRVSDEIELAF